MHVFSAMDAFPIYFVCYELKEMKKHEVDTNTCTHREKIMWPFLA